MVSSVKLPTLRKGEYILWTMKMEQYLAHTDYALWEVILNEGLDKGYDRFQRILSLLEIHRAGVSTKDANKKFLRSLPSAWSNISLIMRNKSGIDNLDIDDLYNNLKVYEVDIKGSFRSSSNSQNVAFVSVESTSSTNKLNAAYTISTTTGHSSQAQGSSSYADELMFSFFANQSCSPQLDNKDLEQIDQDDLEEMDFKWQVKCFNCHRRGHFTRDCRTARNLRNRGRGAGNAGCRGRDNGNRHVREEYEKELVVQDGLSTYDWSYQLEEEATNFAFMAFTSNPSSSSSSNSELDEALRDKEDLKSKLEKFETSSKNLTKLLDKEEVTETMFDNYSSNEENSLANDRFKKGERFHAVPPPLIGNYVPPKPDLSFTGLDDFIYKFKISETVTSLYKDVKDAPKTSTAFVEKPKEVRTNAPLI
nr:hypothetical protein [Tanacetum cinerariifolium]